MKELAVILEDALRNKVEEDGVMHDAHYEASEALHKAMSLRSAIGTVTHRSQVEIIQSL